MIYIVQPGDTLRAIAIRVLGSEAPAATLWQINKARIKSGTPNQLTPANRSSSRTKWSRRVRPIDVERWTLTRSFSSSTGWSTPDGRRFESRDRSKQPLVPSTSILRINGSRGSQPWPIFEWDEVKVYIGADLLISGYVEEVEFSLDDGSHVMRVAGSDRTVDLVDCSAMLRPGVIKGKKLEEAASILAKPFGIEVVTDQDTGPAIASFALQPGEKVFEAISRAAIAKHLLVTSRPDGSLLITRSGSRRATDAIVEGKNLKSGSSRSSSRDRFSDYIVEGQSSGQGQAKNGQRGTYRDPGFPRYRPLMLQAEQKATAEYVKARAQFEARARAAKSQGAVVVVVGWRQSDGTLWDRNRSSQCNPPPLGSMETCSSARSPTNSPSQVARP
ncbi:hypothetical protein U1Q18_052068 [Sarracenia purpurea var. burkii]